MKNIVKDPKGITLVALTVTIAVIMILAGITLNTTLGKNGLITIMRETEQNQTLAQEEGQAKLDELKQEEEYTEDGVKVVSDTDAPKINSIKVTDRTKYSITIKANITETKSGIAVIRYKIGDGDWQTDSTNSRATTYTFTGLEEATIYEITVEATDVEDHTATATMKASTYSISLNEAQKDNMVRKTINTPILIGEDRVIIPSGFKIAYDSAKEVSGGIVIEDKDGNQFVWIEVPKTTDVYGADNLNIANFTDAELNTIKTKLIAYATDYRSSSYSDIWYDGCGVSQANYEAMYNRMLKSVYQNGGFWIGRYEIGIDENTVRNYGTDFYTEHSTTGQTPVIKANKIPYNYIRCSQAEELAETFAPSGYTSSLMFGLQWDLVLKYLETNGATQEELNGTTTGSTNWGNYNNANFTVTNTNAKYSEENGASWNPITAAGYTKASSSSRLLTTGANETRNSKMNICDLAGNVWEWTLEYTSISSLPCTLRGGSYLDDGSPVPASYRYNGSTTGSNSNIGARVALY